MVLDSNILIYAADPQDRKCAPFLEMADAAISFVTRIEVLGFPGFHLLPDQQRSDLVQITQFLVELPVDERVILRAISLRQRRKMSLADAIIAATALVHAHPLVTRNVDDFRHVEGLRMINPFD